MKVFVSWSGQMSHDVALVLHDLLPNMVQRLEPYVSSEEIDKGARWFSDIAGELEESDFGILCLTRSNLSAPWILFEAGALSKRLDRSRVAPLLVDLEPSDFKGPLAQFQATLVEREDMLLLVSSLNGALGEDSLDETVLKRSFDKWWPELSDRLGKAASKPRPGGKATSRRTDREILSEILEHVRSLSRAVPGTPDAAAEWHSVLLGILDRGKQPTARDRQVCDVLATHLAAASNTQEQGQMFRSFLRYYASTPEPEVAEQPSETGDLEDGDKQDSQSGEPHN